MQITHLRGSEGYTSGGMRGGRPAKRDARNQFPKQSMDPVDTVMVGGYGDAFINIKATGYEQSPVKILSLPCPLPWGFV